VEIFHPVDPFRSKLVPAGASYVDLLVPVIRGGELVYSVPPLTESQSRTRSQLEQLSPSVKRLINPHAYPAGIERSLAEEKSRLAASARALTKP
jgi:nicotinate phosphoribosyltransferase